MMTGAGETVTRSKLQAASFKQQASSAIIIQTINLQASSGKRRNP